ncbi:MAG: cell envelope biogenesis protein OmpA [Halobacteriovoraceae bacterium]|nr:cell envelope biogenesis protein OmpA [Halobacteriovoraceae bacterium]
MLCGCSSNPVLYPNQKYKKVGKEKAKRDIQVCKDESEEFLESSKGKQILKGAARGGIFGTIMGGVTGLITGDVGKGLAQGAVIGGAAGATAEAISPDELRRAYVNTCLRDKGYRVLGWD